MSQHFPGGQILYEWLTRTFEDFHQLLELARRANSTQKQVPHIPEFIEAFGATVSKSI